MLGWFGGAGGFCCDSFPAEKFVWGEVVGAGVFPVASSDVAGEMAAGGGIYVADKAFLVTCGAWVFCASLAGVRSGMASADASCNGVTWCYRGNLLCFLLLERRRNVTRRVVTLFALV